MTVSFSASALDDFREIGDAIAAGDTVRTIPSRATTTLPLASPLEGVLATASYRSATPSRPCAVFR